MSLKLGAWEINANGRKSTLRLDVVNDDGQVRGAFNPQPGQDIVWTLAGFFQVIDLQLLQLDLGNARRNVFGWFAQITEAS